MASDWLAESLLFLTRMLAVLPNGELVSTPLIELNDATSLVNHKSGVGLPMTSVAFHLCYQRPLNAPEKMSLRRIGVRKLFIGATFIPGGLGQCTQYHIATTTELSFDRDGIPTPAGSLIDLSMRVVGFSRARPLSKVRHLHDSSGPRSDSQIAASNGQATFELRMNISNRPSSFAPRLRRSSTTGTQG